MTMDERAFATFRGLRGHLVRGVRARLAIFLPELDEGQLGVIAACFSVELSRYDVREPPYSPEVATHLREGMRRAEMFDPPSPLKLRHEAEMIIATVVDAHCAPVADAILAKLCTLIAKRGEP